MKPEDLAEIMKTMKTLSENASKNGISVQIPPNSFLDMNGEFLEYQKNKSLTVQFPVKENQTNPLGMMQGGYIAAAFDNTFGPLSYLVAKKPMVTIDLSCQYIRGVEKGQNITVEARIVARGFSTLHMTGEMYSENRKLLATSSTNLLILKTS